MSQFIGTAMLVGMMAFIYLAYAKRRAQKRANTERARKAEQERDTKAKADAAEIVAMYRAAKAAKTEPSRAEAAKSQPEKPQPTNAQATKPRLALSPSALPLKSLTQSRKDATQQVVVRSTSADGVRMCTRHFYNLISSEADILRSLPEYGFSFVSGWASEDHDPGDQDWDSGSVDSGDVEAFIALTNRICGEWRMTAVYKGTKVVIHKPYPSIAFALSFTYPEAMDDELRSVFGRFRVAHCYAIVATTYEERDVPKRSATQKPGPVDPAKSALPADVFKTMGLWFKRHGDGSVCVSYAIDVALLGQDATPLHCYTPEELIRMRKADFVNGFAGLPVHRPELDAWLEANGVAFAADATATPVALLPGTAIMHFPDSAKALREERLKDMLDVAFTADPRREDAVVDCMLRYSRLDAPTIRDLLHGGEVGCYIHRSHIEAFCREMARLESPVTLSLRACNLDVYCFDPLSDAFYRRDKVNGLVRVAPSDMPISYCILEPAALCLFGTGSFTSFRYFTREHHGELKYQWESPGREWDFFTSILRFSDGADLEMLREPRHGYTVGDWPSRDFFHAVSPAGHGGDPLPVADAPRIIAGTVCREPDFPAGDRFHLFTVSMKSQGMPDIHAMETEAVSLSVGLYDGQLYLETTYSYDAPAMGREKPERVERVSYDGLDALIAAASKPIAGFFKGMNAENWRDYVGRRYRQDRDRNKRSTRIEPSDLLESPKPLEAFYLYHIPPVSINYFRWVGDGWRLFCFEPRNYGRFEKDVYASRFASDGEGAVDDLKRTASARDCWYERVLTPLEVRYLRSQLQLNGLYEKVQGERIPRCQGKYASYTKARGRLYQNVQAWYMLDGQRCYLQDFVNFVPYGMSYDELLNQIFLRLRFGCELSPEPAKPARPAESAKPVPTPEKQPATQATSPASQPVQSMKPEAYTGGEAVRVVASRLTPDMARISPETLFKIGSPSDTLRKVNCTFYHPAFAQSEKGWMSMKSAWQKRGFCCVVMTDQSDEWARDLSKSLNRHLPSLRILFLRPVMLNGQASLSPEVSPQTIARWHAPLENRYYKNTVEWEGFSYDGSEDYYSLMLYED